MFNDIDLMQLLRLIGKEFQNITAIKDTLKAKMRALERERVI